MESVNSPAVPQVESRDGLEVDVFTCCEPMEQRVRDALKEPEVSLREFPRAEQFEPPEEKVA